MSLLTAFNERLFQAYCAGVQILLARCPCPYSPLPPSHLLPLKGSTCPGNSRPRIAEWDRFGILSPPGYPFVVYDPPRFAPIPLPEASSR
jgi:hypothetical protein